MDRTRGITRPKGQVDSRLWAAARHFSSLWSIRCSVAHLANFTMRRERQKIKSVKRQRGTRGHRCLGARAPSLDSSRSSMYFSRPGKGRRRVVTVCTKKLHAWKTTQEKRPRSICLVETLLRPLTIHGGWALVGVNVIRPCASDIVALK